MPEYTIIDGYKIDNETGEVVGFESAFEVHDESSFEWVMEKIQALDTEKAGLQARRQAVLDNIAAMERTADQKIQSLLFRFENELVNYAKENLPKGKKTYTCPYGSVAFRTSKAALAVEDENLCLEAAKDYGWDNAIKVTEKFLISQVPKEGIEKLMNNPLEAAACGFIVKPSEETAKISTGVK